MPRLHLYIDQPTPIFKARVNIPGDISYPLGHLTYDNVTLGAYTDIEFDATVTLGTTEGGDDLGRVRVKQGATSTYITIPRTGQGTEDGTLEVQDNAYITVWDDYRVWAKIPFFNLDNGNDYKDGDVPVGTYLTDIPPVANCGSWVADYIDPDTGLLEVTFPNDGVNLSYAMADGATIDTHAWDVKDGTITVGTAADDVITATFPPGRRWISHTVVDTNGVPHTSRCLVVAIDPDDDVTFKQFNVTQRLEKKGQVLDIEIFADLDRDTYPDGTAVMFWWDSMSSPGDRSHMKFVGWLADESMGMERKKEGFTRSTRLKAIDINGRLDVLPGFPQALSRIEDESPWSYMPSLDMNKSLHYLLLWHSNALSLADFILPSDGGDYDAMRLDAGGDTLFNQVNNQAQKMVPDHYLTCNTMGQMEVIRDWMLDDVGDRPAASPIIQESQWNRLSVEYNRHPKVHVLRSGAILSSTELDENDEIPLVFSIAPSNASAFSQGTSEQQENEGLALTQDDLNDCEGHRYALLNSRYGDFKFDDPTGYNFWNYEPAMMKRVQLNIGAAYAAQRGLPFTQTNGQIQSINVQYNTDKRGTSIRPSAVLKKEESGHAAITWEPEDQEDVGYVPPEVTIPDFDDDVVFGGDITGFIVWNSTHMARTWDLQVSEPEWEDITGDLTGSLLDAQYFMPDPDTCGVWCMTDEGIFLCMDIMASTPVWEEVLSIATVVSEDAAPSSGSVQFQSMAHYWAQPGHLCVATEPDSSVAYSHAYYRITEDYGQNWTIVDVNNPTFESSGVERAYSFIGRYGLAAMRGVPTLYAMRNTSRTGLSTGRTILFRSEDKGYTWAEAQLFDNWSPGYTRGAILHPFPATSNASYIARGYGSTGQNPQLLISTGGWTGATPLTPPTGFGPGTNPNNVRLRPNKRTFDDDHIIMLMTEDSTGDISLFESYDQGATWDELLSDVGNSWQTPSGWPPDVNQWVVIDISDAPYVQLTLDNFGTLLDRDGDLVTVLDGWGGTFADGFALPKVGANAD